MNQTCAKPCIEIAALLRERRYTRFLCLTRDVPWIEGHCAWCGTPQKRGKYCSVACSNEANIRASGQVVSRLLHRRDKGVCAKCGIDCDWLDNQRRMLWMVKSRMSYVDANGLSRNSLPGSWGPWQCGTDRLWHADHVLPVCLGGGVCGLENYQTLCVRCHKAESKTLSRQRAAWKRGGLL